MKRVGGVLCILLATIFGAPLTHPGFAGMDGSETREISRGKFLIATRLSMRDPRFGESIVLIVRHGSEGTLGLILNHPTQLTVHEVFPDITDALHLTNVVYLGGPVAPRQFSLLVRTNKKFQGSWQVTENTSFSSDPEAIKDWVARETQKDKIRLFAGYSGWAPGQLQSEIAVGAWELWPADEKTIFEIDPEQMWEELSRRTTLQQASVKLEE